MYFAVLVCAVYAGVSEAVISGEIGKLANDFETGMGMWKSQGTLWWRRRSGGTSSSKTGPSGDHTTGKGWYVYVETSGKHEGDQGKLEANTQSLSDACVMNFHYNMYGSTMGKLEVKLNGNVVFSKSGDQGNQWKQGSVTIAKGNAAIQFVATRGSGYMSDIAIDDITFSARCGPVAPGQLATDFETDNGMWNSQGTLQWTRRWGNSGSIYTGPRRDHTTGHGWYMHMRTYERPQGDQARLEANTRSASDSCVMNFYYHMYGAVMGRLEVKLNGNVVFSKSGDQGNQWKHGSVPIPKGNAAVQFVATRPKSWLSDMGIDDVSFSTGCSSVTVAPTATPTVTPGRLDTDFETDNGMWNSHGQWTRRSGGTYTSRTGPSADHTTGRGMYVYMEASGKIPGHQARLEASTQSASDSCVMNFYYHMYGGSQMGKLEVKLNGRVVFLKSGNQGNQWKRGSVNIPKGNTKIEFVATRGSGYESDIAIDDVTSSNC
ncbi:MAM and LDL-receptor class A domain-containing protein 1-like [Tubulanus polymorphus]|uniref:MAM and LDL-receptor class A domain-containing protein 1-like n=1 Tax=Tubulanus polymorphus TaxID=672921 RepID=UPI003DA4DCE6